MSKIAVLGDLHWGVRNSSLHFLDHQVDFFEKIFFPYIIENKITDIIQTGDFFDTRKSMNIQILNCVRVKFIERLADLGCTLHIIPGNHDIYYRHSNEVNSISEVLSFYPHVKIYNEPTTVDFDGMFVDFIPWINKSNSAKYLNYIKSSSSQCCVGHFEINGFEMYAGIDSSGGMRSEIFSNYELTLSGHYHHRSSKFNITYVGTPYELTWSDYSDTKGFHILDTESRELVFIENPLMMFKKAFYSSDVDYTGFDFSELTGTIVKVIIQDKVDIDKYEWFLTKVNEQHAIDISVVDSDVTIIHGIDEKKLETMDTFVVLSNAAKATAENEGLNVEETIKIIHGLYHEAITLGRDS